MRPIRRELDLVSHSGISMAELDLDAIEEVPGTDNPFEGLFSTLLPILVQ